MRDDDFVEVLPDDLAHLLGRPAAAELAGLDADAFHPLVICAGPPENGLGQGAADHRRTGDQAITVEGTGEHQCA